MRFTGTTFGLLTVLATATLYVLCVAAPAHYQTLGALLIGWLRYPARLAGERAIDWSNTILCTTCLAGLTIGVHYFGRWLAANRPTPTAWPLPRTLKLVGIVMLMFIGGIMAIGIIHEGTWLAIQMGK